MCSTICCRTTGGSRSAGTRTTSCRRTRARPSSCWSRSSWTRGAEVAREYAGARLDQPKQRRQALSLKKPSFDPDAFGRVSEQIARFFGTARYLAIQTAIVCVWILLNIMQLTQAIHWDPYPFILLNLAFSTQAAYAAPLILLAQNRQAERDVVQIQEDRNREQLSIATM